MDARMMSRAMADYALQIAESYLSFLSNYEYYDDAATAEAYARAILSNDREKIVGAVLEIVRDMTEREEV
jgi:hypothetical protein